MAFLLEEDGLKSTKAEKAEMFQFLFLFHFFFFPFEENSL